MKGHSLVKKPRILLAGMGILLAGHGIILYYVSSHTAVSAAVVSGVIVLIVIKHLGLLGPLYALFRRRANR
jgi:hypothetical protein